MLTAATMLTVPSDMTQLVAGCTMTPSLIAKPAPLLSAVVTAPPAVVENWTVKAEKPTAGSIVVLNWKNRTAPSQIVPLEVPWNVAAAVQPSHDAPLRSVQAMLIERRRGKKSDIPLVKTLRSWKGLLDRVAIEGLCGVRREDLECAARVSAGVALPKEE